MPDGQNNGIRRKFHGVLGIIGWAEVPLPIHNRGAFLEADGNHPTLYQAEFLRPPAVEDIHPFFFCLRDTPGEGRHLFPLLQTDQVNFFAPSRQAVWAASTAAFPPPITTTRSPIWGGFLRPTFFMKSSTGQMAGNLFPGDV